MPDKTIPFPNNNTPKKDKEYYLQAVKAFWSQKEHGLTAFPTDYITKLKENRSYAKGEQSTDRYIDYYASDEGSTATQRIQDSFVDSGLTKEQVREGFANMDFTNIPSPAPKISLALHGQMDEIGWVVSAKSTDAWSGKERDKIKWRSWLMKSQSEWFKRVSALGGVQMEEPEFWPDSIAELHLHESAGGYKIPWETAIEKAISHSFDVSNWDEVKSECLDDIIADNRFAVRVKTCEKSGKRIAEYVDLANFAIQYSKHYDHRDSEMAGYWEEVTVGELSRFFDREELESIAKKYTGKYNNPDDFEPYKGVDAMGMFKYDFFKVPVFHFSFIDYDTDTKASYLTPYGRRIERSVRHDYQPKKREKKITTSIRKLKKVSWIIDTDCVYEWGEDNDMVRPDEKDVMIPYVCISLPGKSITESAKVYYDDIVHIHARMQNALITASAAGFALDVGALEGVTLGGKKVDELTLFDLYRHKNILLFKRRDSHLQGTGMGHTPLHELPGGIGRFLEENMTLFEHTMRQLEHITGINPVSLGGLPEERQAVRNVAMAQAGTDNVLRPIVRGLKNLHKRVATNFALSIPYLMQNYKKSFSAYESVIGTPSAELLKMIGDNIYQMGIDLQPMLTQQHAQNLMRMVDLALQKDAQGQAGLDIPEALLIQEKILQGSSLKMVRLEVANLLRRAQKRIDQQRDAMARVQGEQAQQLEAQKHQQTLQEKDVETQGKVDIENVKHDNTIKELYAKGNIDYLTQVIQEIEEDEQQMAEV